MASKFPAYLASGVRAPLVLPFTPAAAQTFGPQSLVFYDNADEFIKLCGADPALILGFSQGGAAGKLLTSNGKIGVHVLDPDDVIAMSSPTTPAETHVTDAFGILMDAGTGFWQADPTDAANARIHCVGVDIPNGIFFVKFMAANLQLDAIAS